MKMTPKMKNDQKTPILDSVFKIVILGPFGILDLIFIYILTPNSLESVLKSSNCDLQDESYAIFEFLGGTGVVERSNILTKKIRNFFS